MGHPEENLAATGVVDSRELLPALASLPGHLVWRAHGRVALALAEELPDGVDIHAYAVLLALGTGPPRSQQELADAVSVSRTTLTRVAADLVARGLVERVRNPDDRRSYALTRTPDGARAARDWQQHADALEARLTSAYTAAERRDLHRLLLRVVEPHLSPSTPDDLRASVSFLVSRAHAVLHRLFLDALEPHDLEPRLISSMIAIESTGPVAQAELARLLGVSGARLVQIADALESRGLVERRRDPADRRTWLLHLLPAGTRAVEVARHASDFLQGGLDPLTDAEAARLAALLRTFVTAP